MLDTGEELKLLPYILPYFFFFSFPLDIIIPIHII